MSIDALVTEALSDVAASEVGEAIQIATITRSSPGRVYDTGAGKYVDTPAETITGRAVFAEAKTTDILPEGTGGPGDMILWLFEATGTPREGDTIVCSGRSYSIAATPADVSGLGGVMFKMVVRRT